MNLRQKMDLRTERLRLIVTDLTRLMKHTPLGVYFVSNLAYNSQTNLRHTTSPKLSNPKQLCLSNVSKNPSFPGVKKGTSNFSHTNMALLRKN